MKTNAYKNELRDNSLAATLKDIMNDMTKEFDFVLPRGWRFIAKIMSESDKGTPPHQLFLLDIQADEGGGSWAEGKVQTMEMMNLPATQPLPAGRVRNWILDAGMQNTAHAKEILALCDSVYADPKDESPDFLDTSKLSPEAVHWLVDVKNGPGIAPNFGGLKLEATCDFYEENHNASLNSSKWNAVTETDTIYVAFSGAAAWQDLQFATRALKAIAKHLDNLPDESFDFDFEPLEKIPEVKLWLKNYGLV